MLGIQIYVQSYIPLILFFNMHTKLGSVLIFFLLQVHTFSVDIFLCYTVEILFSDTLRVIRLILCFWIIKLNNILPLSTITIKFSCSSHMIKV
jgi:hypothetical protein